MVDMIQQMTTPADSQVAQLTRPSQTSSANNRRQLAWYRLAFLYIILFTLLMAYHPFSHAQYRPPERLIAPHLVKLTPYQKQILDKFTQFEPLVSSIFQQLEQRALPDHLVLIPMLESSFNPNAVSHANAAGLWQLMPLTAQRFGLKVSTNNDQRFDIAASTSAALQYLSFLHHKFGGDISLTLAAYNAGEGRVQRAIKRAGSTQFSQLTLPQETVNYVHRFYALQRLVNISELKSKPSAAFMLFVTDQQWQKSPLINLSPLPPLISL
ncbi:lytic transglycosylase domain-containing protein [Vibrio sp. ZSDZ65]|uniref:Lytic transglycosylase domain-containing protein n=2 Tax=Vibrio qingdaonensis TaxID=2829491 RepID=A0A9X3CJS6_9VIBR|nr:lytic transglycosylase domain-containing protein [Vibrio qingdaonensis]MCW8344596.1 lytic transglycosylase domain-containing protein [Vibrio qingdaonensis]